MKTLFLFIATLLFTAKVLAQNDTLYLSVQDCIDLALENNYPLKNAQLDIEKAKALKNEVRAEYFPSMSAQAFTFAALNPMLSIGINDIDNALVQQTLNNFYAQYGALLGLEKHFSLAQQGTIVNLMVTEPLYAGGRIRTGNRLAKMGVEAAEYEAMIKSDGIKLVTEFLYWQIIALEDKKITLDRLDQLLDTLNKDLNGAIEAGLLMPTDQYKLTVKKNESALNRKKVENGIVLLKMALAQQIGVDWQLMDLTDTLGLEEEPTAYYQNPQEMVSSQKELQLFDLSIQAERLKKKLTLGEALPTLLIGGSAYYHTLLNDTKPNALVFAIMQVPITDWHKTAWKLKKHDLDIQKAENTRNELAEQLQLRTNLAWFNLEQSYLKIGMAQTALDDAEANLKIANDYYEAGLISLAELLEAQTLMQQSHNELIDSRMNYHINLTTYKQLMR